MYRLIGAGHSYYTGKARSHLISKGVPFEEVTASEDVLRLVRRQTGVLFLPVLLLPDGTTVQDTSDIFDAIERLHPELPAFVPESPVLRFLAHLIEMWADEWLILPAMHYRWSFPDCNLSFLEHEWGAMLRPDLPAASPLRLAAARKSLARFRDSLPALGITAETIPGIESTFLELLAALEAHFQSHPYLLGSRPSLADCALMGPMYAHLGRDPYPVRIVRSRAPAVARWIDRMNGQLPARDRAHAVSSDGTTVLPLSQQSPGEFFEDGALPETLRSIVRLILRDHVPVLVDTVGQLEEWQRGVARTSTRREEVPRVLPCGFRRFTIGGCTGQRLIFPYTVWMLQRALKTVDDRGEVERFVRQFPLGGPQLFALRERFAAGAKVERRNNRLCHAHTCESSGTTSKL